MMSARLAIPDFLEIKIFQSKGYDVIILDYGITNKILSLDLNDTSKIFIEFAGH